MRKRAASSKTCGRAHTRHRGNAQISLAIANHTSDFRDFTKHLRDKNNREGTRRQSHAHTGGGARCRRRAKAIFRKQRLPPDRQDRRLVRGMRATFAMTRSQTRRRAATNTRAMGRGVGGWGGLVRTATHNDKSGAPKMHPTSSRLEGDTQTICAMTRNICATKPNSNARGDGNTRTRGWGGGAASSRVDRNVQTILAGTQSIRASTKARRCAATNAHVRRRWCVYRGMEADRTAHNGQRDINTTNCAREQPT